MSEQQPWSEWIVSNPEILGGKPIVRGTRISVEFVLELLASGATQPEILEHYPHIPAGETSGRTALRGRRAQRRARLGAANSRVKPLDFPLLMDENVQAA